MNTRDVLDLVAAERVRQDTKWGEQNHPDGTGLPGDVEEAEAAKKRCDAEHRAGKGTWRSILKEEVQEAFAESDEEALKVELVQVQAVAAGWYEAICRRQQRREKARAEAKTT